ncbi:hypothetical protein POM88_005090 [Heracleum sosnowskyi]|uniref:RING-type domain-containing protein n=1 Tax=Heracleum sosnowskyi TaxID=360622 RepID=A0AAD8JJ96_9APIA|nr:hypothetical protein POM88_005090 [Heracleum sosnowskyi]
MVFLVFHEYLYECPELSIVKAKTSDKAKKPRHHRLFSFGIELSEFMEKRKLIDISDIVNIGDEPIIFLFKEYIKDFSHCFLALPVVSFIKQDTMTTTVLGPILLLKDEAFPLIPYSNISNEIYEFWEPDPHHKNVMHGNMCMFRDGEKTHSCMIFSKVSEAYEMETYLRGFREITENIVDPRAIQYIKPVQFGSSEIPPSTVILITQKIPKTTLTEWLTSSPSQEDLLSLFIDLFSSLKNIHQNSMCFGNVSGGIRISGNKPVLAFLAKFKVKDLDEGIWKDLGDLRKMDDDSMPLSHERTLFDDLCDNKTSLSIPVDIIQANLKSLEEAVAMRKEIHDLRTSARIFQLSKCTACTFTLDLPAVHFMCKHSFHQRRLGDYEKECPECASEYRSVLEMKRSLEQNCERWWLKFLFILLII